MAYSNIPASITAKLSDEQKYTLQLLIENKEQRIQHLIESKEQMIQIKNQEVELLGLKSQSQIKELEDRLCEANYKILLSQKLLSVRSFIHYIKDVVLCKTKGSYDEKFQALGSKHPKLLEKWKIDTDEYFNIYKGLMKKLNMHAHPFFDCEEVFMLSEYPDGLNYSELQLIGFIWSSVPLHPKNLLIRKLDKEVISLFEFIQQ